MAGLAPGASCKWLYYNRHPSMSQGAVFVDVDYPALVERKRSRILNHDALRNLLLETNVRPSQPPIYLRSERYLALGCDLRDLKALEKLLKATFDATNTSFMFVAEVSVTYMPTSEADALIQWASTLDDCTYRTPSL